VTYYLEDNVAWWLSVLAASLYYINGGFDSCTSHFSECATFTFHFWPSVIAVGNFPPQIGPGKALQIANFTKRNNLPPITFRWIMKYEGHSNHHGTKGSEVQELNVM